MFNKKYPRTVMTEATTLAFRLMLRALAFVVGEDVWPQHFSIDETTVRNDDQRHRRQYEFDGSVCHLGKQMNFHVEIILVKTSGDIWVVDDSVTEGYTIGFSHLRGCRVHFDTFSETQSIKSFITLLCDGSSSGGNLNSCDAIHEFRCLLFA